MNILEHYIKEVISVEPYTEDWTKKWDKEFVEVKVLANCYGGIQEYTNVWDKAQWEQIKKQGYFMA